MWPLIYQFLRSNSRFVVLPIAVVIGAIGYGVESKLRKDNKTMFNFLKIFFQIVDLVSSKYTPATVISIEQQRIERLTSEDELGKFKSFQKATYENVLEKNVSASNKKQ